VAIKAREAKKIASLDQRVLRKKLTTLQAAIAVLSLNAAAMLAQLLVYIRIKQVVKRKLLRRRQKSVIYLAPRSQNFLSP